MKFISVLFGLYVLTVASLFSYQPVIPSYTPIKHDSRITALAVFMEKHQFVKPYYVKEIIQDADKNSIPASLLVCIELQESSGGRRFNTASHNPFGWGSGKVSFETESDAIDYISRQLGTGTYYAGKSTKSKLNAYNPNPAYAGRVMACMKEINE